MKRFSVLLSLSTLLFQDLPAAAVPPAQPARVKSFAEWCQQKNNVPDKTRKTIDILLKKVDAEDCQVANTKLKSITELEFHKSEIDLQILSGLTNLNKLKLYVNNIKNLKPLASLINLKELELDCNIISDVKHLAGLINL